MKTTLFFNKKQYVLCLNLWVLGGFLCHAQEQKFRFYGNRSYIDFLKKQGIIENKILPKEVEAKFPLTLSLSFFVMVEGVTKEQLLSQVRVLNEDFSNKTFEKADNKSQTYKALATNTEIKFCESFQFTPMKTKYNFESAQELLKNTQTDTRRIPIYVVELDLIAGYAQPPGFSAETDAIFIDKDYLFGAKTEGFELGKTLTHLIGVYLGLGELWDCREDGIADTPLMAVQHFDHEGSMSSCYGYVVRTMPQNFMYNTEDKYMNMFTKGQTQKMQLELRTRRKDLLDTVCQ